ncbi:MAG: rhodanese-like domain-containing protein [Spirochaetes bacterium]|nr:rhodanese-like domain-containing protein [Spirochaetota bacterium]
MLVTTAILAFAGGCRSSAADAVTVREKIRQGALVVDVRTPGEFDAGHYPGAINIPLGEIEAEIQRFGRADRPVVLYCRSGNRSGRAKAILEERGFTDVTNGGAYRDMIRL